MHLKSPAIFIGVQGNGFISFGSGQPDLPPPDRVFSILPNYRQFKYGLVQGQENLRQALSAEYKGSTKDNFVITNGASEAGKIDIDDFDKKVRGCKAVLINSPCNPTGRVQEISTLKQIEKLCADLKITIISDEVYKDLIYERENYMLHGDHVVTVNSFSKTFAMCGYRVGYLYSNDMPIVENVVEEKTHTSMNTCNIAQEMAYEAMQAPPEYIKEQVKIWKERRDVIYAGLQKLGLELEKPEGAFYVLA